MGIGIETASTAATQKPGVIDSFGSTGPVRGIGGEAKVEISKSNPGPAVIAEIDGKVTISTAFGPGGRTSTSFETPKPSTPLSRASIDLKA